MISTEIISEGLEHKNTNVRRRAAKLLRERDALEISTAERLISDDDATVRFEALQSLVGSGKQFSDDEAERILVKPSTSPSHGPFFGATDSAGENCLAHFRQQQLIAMTDRELREQVAGSKSIFDRDAEFAWAERQFSGPGRQLRASVDDYFKADFDQTVDKMERKYGASGDLIEKTKSIEEHLRKELTRKGLDVICRIGDPQDLDRVRQVLKSGFVEHSDADLDYLRKFGEWEDIPLIIASVARKKSDGLPSLLDSTKYRTAARAIYTLGRTRFAELLTLDAPARLLSHIIVESSDAVFRTLSDASVKSLLGSEHDYVRKVAALKCIRAFPKNRLTPLLRDYVSGEGYRYYNVVHWLDLGASLPNGPAVRAANKALLRAWKEQ